MKIKKQCSCGTGTRVIFACSGAADVGAIADQAARKLARDGAGKMYCLGAVAARVDDVLANTAAAASILAIDGCSTGCTKKTLELAGFTAIEHLCLADPGVEKGKSPVTRERRGCRRGEGAMRFLK